ncbi:hypothetical protein M885DRAFT_341481 [Pelagophyceae sp. CCMP2097]|nr:hypothetical protein M885DRAFT_341481 [Pelagophyceae sp. CCMP2097]
MFSKPPHCMFSKPPQFSNPPHCISPRQHPPPPPRRISRRAPFRPRRTWRRPRRPSARPPASPPPAVPAAKKRRLPRVRHGQTTPDIRRKTPSRRQRRRKPLLRAPTAGTPGAATGLGLPFNTRVGFAGLRVLADAFTGSSRGPNPWSPFALSCWPTHP